jgi:hypothetical protein
LAAVFSREAGRNMDEVMGTVIGAVKGFIIATSASSLPFGY